MPIDLMTMLAEGLAQAQDRAEALGIGAPLSAKLQGLDPEDAAALDAALGDTSGGGDKDFPDMAVEVSSYRRCWEGDPVLDTAASRLSVSVSDAIVMAGDALTLSARLFNDLNELKDKSPDRHYTPADRRDALVQMTGKVIIPAEDGEVADPAMDFQVLMLRQEKIPFGNRHMRHYRLFFRDGMMAMVPYTFYSGSYDKGARENLLRRDGIALADSVGRLRVAVSRGRAIGGLDRINDTRAMAAKYEAISREVRGLPSGKGQRKFSSDVEEKFELLWDQIELAREAIAVGTPLPLDFDARNASLMIFLGKSTR